MGWLNFLLMIYKITPELNLIKARNYKYWFLFFFTTSLFLSGFIAYLYNLKPTILRINTVKVVPVDEQTIPDIPLNDSAILDELIREGSVLPSVALAQAKIESSHYKSPICKENKNLFGIKYHKCLFVSGQKNNHATYKNYRDNIKCYIHIQKHYLGKIDNHYAESPGYVNAIKTIK